MRERKKTENEDIVVCRCEEVTLKEIRAAIKNGAASVEEVKKMTRAGMGLCQSKTCFALIASIIATETGLPPEKILPSRHRFPARPLKINKI